MVRSLIKQVKDCFEAIAGLGESRHAAKQAGTAQRQIFSHATYTTYLDRCIAVVKWIQTERNPTLRELRAITHSDLAAYIRHCERSGQAGGSIRSTISALRKLETGMRALRWWSDPILWVPADLATSTPRSSSRLGFSLADVQDLLAHVGAEARLAIRIALAANLRIREIVTLRVADIDREHQTLTVRGKGGKRRTVLVRDPMLLTELPTRGNWLFKGTPRSVIRRIQQDIAQPREALEIPGPGMNVHAVRALHAELLLREAIMAGIDETAAREMISRQMGHNRVSVMSAYCPPLTARPRRRRRPVSAAQPGVTAHPPSHDPGTDGSAADAGQSTTAQSTGRANKEAI
jgi:integrase